MNKTINNIIDDFKSGKILWRMPTSCWIEAGAGFSLNPEKNPMADGPRQRWRRDSFPARKRSLFRTR